MKQIIRTFLKGFFAVIPIALTGLFLFWLATKLEQVLGGALRWILPSDWYLPGMGLVVGLVLTAILGLLLQTWIMKRIWAWGESLLERVPLVRFVYRAIKQVVDYLSGASAKNGQQVVVVSLGDPTVEVLGFLTRDDLNDLPVGLGSSDSVAVYLPMSYQMGGFTIMVPRDRIRIIDMSLDEGLRFALTAGVSVKAVGSKTQPNNENAPN